MGDFLKSLLQKFVADETTTLAASLAFYTSLSLAPLLILFVTLSTQFSLNLRQQLLAEIHVLVGPDAARAAEAVLAGANGEHHFASGANLGGLAALLISGSLIFGQLRSTLNRIFNVRPADVPKADFLRALWTSIRGRIIHMGLAIVFLFILMGSLLTSFFLSTPYRLINMVVSALFYVGTFALIFRYMPNRRLGLSYAIGGGALTAFFFLIGKEIISLYLGRSAIGSPYGAAGSVVVLLVWVYYSSLITFIGAQVTSLMEGASKRKSSPVDWNRQPSPKPSASRT